MFLRVDSLDGTSTVASALAGLSRPGDVIVLAGEMGAGKTAFAQSFGRALGVTDRITSPTFTLVHSYPTRSPQITLHHADLYRLDSTGDIDDLALNELAEFGGIVLIEWGDVAPESFGDHLVVSLTVDDEDFDADVDADLEAELDDTFDASNTAREIEIMPVGHGWDGRWERLTTALEGFRAC